MADLSLDKLEIGTKSGTEEPSGISRLISEAGNLLTQGIRNAQEHPFEAAGVLAIGVATAAATDGRSLLNIGEERGLSAELAKLYKYPGGELKDLSTEAFSGVPPQDLSLAKAAIPDNIPPLSIEEKSGKLIIRGTIGQFEAAMQKATESLAGKTSEADVKYAATQNVRDRLVGSQVFWHNSSEAGRWGFRPFVSQSEREAMIEGRNQMDSMRAIMGTHNQGFVSQSEREALARGASPIDRTTEKLEEKE